VFKNKYVVLVILCITGFLLYGNVLHAPFQLDDQEFIVNNPAVKNIHDVSAIWKFTPRKFLSLFTIALTYHFFKFDTFPYHLINLLLHILTSFLVYSLVSRLLGLSPEVKGKTGAQRHWLSLCCALFFLVHPLQTESVTYIWQRSTVLSGFFYIAASLWYCKARQERSLLAGVAVVACALIGFFAKGDTVTLPVIFLLMEFSFFGMTLQRLSRRLLHLWPVVVSVVIAVFFFLKPLNTFLQNAYFFSGTNEVSRSAYLFTQLPIIVSYLRLVFFPFGQNVEHFINFYYSFLNPAVILSTIFIIAVCVCGVSLYRKGQRLIPFGIAWFFVCLFPTSSVYPLATAMYEHRLYLPLMGMVLCATVVLNYGLRQGKIRALIGAGIILVLGVLTVSRNYLWRSELALLEDAVRKAPLNVRAQLILGETYYRLGKVEPAFALFKKAVHLSPDNPNAHHDMGIIYLEKKDMQRAKEEFSRAVALNRSYANPYINLAYIALLERQYYVARTLFEESLKYKLTDAALVGLGNLSFLTRKWGEAVAYFQHALVVNPHNKLACYNLGNAFFRLGQYQRAIESYERCITIDPKFVKAYINIGLSYAQLHDDVNSRKYLEKALEINTQGSSFVGRGILRIK
jgi:Flp pilus assembly protein TadD